MLLYSLDYLIILPLAIVAFHTFQAFRYAIDIHQAKTKPELHLGYFVLCVPCYREPTLGLIERSVRPLPQLKRNSDVTSDDIRSAVNKILLGFFTLYE